MIPIESSVTCMRKTPLRNASTLAVPIAFKRNISLTIYNSRSLNFMYSIRENLFSSHSFLLLSLLLLVIDRDHVAIVDTSESIGNVSQTQCKYRRINSSHVNYIANGFPTNRIRPLFYADIHSVFLEFHHNSTFMFFNQASILIRTSSKLHKQSADAQKICLVIVHLKNSG